MSEIFITSRACYYANLMKYEFSKFALTAVTEQNHRPLESGNKTIKITEFRDTLLHVSCANIMDSQETK